MANGETNPQVGHSDSAIAEAECRIERARRQNDAFLDLSGLKLASVPESLKRLPTLQTLNLSNNRLTVLPEWLLNFTQLSLLLLHENPGLGLSDEVLGPKWNEIAGPEQKNPKPPFEIMEHYFGPRAKAVYRWVPPAQPRSNKVSLWAALLIYLGMLLFVPLGYALTTWVKSSDQFSGLVFLVLFTPVFPLGLGKVIPFPHGMEEWNGINLRIVVGYGIYAVLFGMFLFLRQRRAFLVLVFVLFIVLCLNMIGCEQCLREAGRH